MDIDKLFRIVFNNKVIREEIFYFVKNINGKKYDQCNIKWCLENKQFNLLVYKLSKEINKRNEFTIGEFHYFLEHNIELVLLKQIFQIYPNLIPTNEKESSIIIEKCSLGNSILSLLSDNKFKNKHEIIQYLMDELKIKPTKQTLHNLSVDGENLKIIKLMFDKGYFTIKKDCELLLLYCSLKAKDFQFYKLILENNQTFKNEFQNMNNYILNQLLASTCNVEFYKYSFDKLLNDEDKIISIKFTYEEEPILYHLNSKVFKFGNMEIIDYLCNNINVYPKSKTIILYDMVIRSIVKYGMKVIGTNSLDLLKYFLNHQKFNFDIHHIKSMFLSFIKNGNLQSIVYLKQQYGDKLIIDSNHLFYSLTNYHIEIFNWLITYNDGITKLVNCSASEFFNIIQAISYCDPPLPCKSILDPILLNPLSKITQHDIVHAISLTITISNSININHSNRYLYDYLCSFIKNDNLIPEFIQKLIL